MSDDEEPPMPEAGWFRYFGLSGPRERCRDCGTDKPAGFRNACPACGRYPIEAMAEREHTDDA